MAFRCVVLDGQLMTHGLLGAPLVMGNSSPGITLCGPILGSMECSIVINGLVVNLFMAAATSVAKSTLKKKKTALAQKAKAPLELNSS